MDECGYRARAHKLKGSEADSRWIEAGGRTEKCSRATAALVIVLSMTAGAISQQQGAGRSVPSPMMRQLDRALSLAEHGDPQSAMDIALQLLAQDPKFVPAMKLKGMLLEDAGHNSEAAATYEQALALTPNDPDLLLKTGMYKLAAGEKQEAIRLLQHCIRILPGDGDAQFYLAQAYHLNGQDGLALHAIQESAKAEPENAAVLQKYGELLSSLRDSQSGLLWLKKAQHLDAGLARLDFDIGAADLKLMDLSGAAESLTRAVAANPNDANALALLASTEIKLSNWQEAKDAYTQYLASNPNDAESLLGVGHCEVELKDFATAVETLNATLRQDPQRLLAHFYLSRAYAGMGKTAEAQHEAALHHLMMEQATFVRSAANEQRESAIVAQARQLLTEHRQQEAIDLYRGHFKGTSATAGDSYVFVGKLELYLGDTEGGLRDLHHALTIEPKVRGAHTYEGILDLKLGNLDAAEGQFKAELASDPNYQTAIAEMGEVRYHQQRWQEAADYLDKSKTMTPELIYMLCDSYFHLGKASDADLYAETSAAYGQSDARFIEGLAELLRRNGQPELALRLSGGVSP